MCTVIAILFDIIVLGDLDIQKILKWVHATGRSLEQFNRSMKISPAPKATRTHPFFVNP